MRGYDLAAWEPFFSVIVAAAATLTGLLFVAVSINLDHILKGSRFLPARAAEILIIVVPMLAITVWSQLNHRRRSRYEPSLWTLSRMVSTALATVPCTIAGISLAAKWGGGLYWLAPTALLGIVGAVYNAWVLLVEIVR